MMQDNFDERLSNFIKWIINDSQPCYISTTGWLMCEGNTVTGVREKNNLYWFK